MIENVIGGVTNRFLPPAEVHNWRVISRCRCLLIRTTLNLKP